MNRFFETLLERVLPRWIDAVRRHAAVITLASAIVTVLAGAYVATQQPNAVGLACPDDNTGPDCANDVADRRAAQAAAAQRSTAETNDRGQT